MRLQAKLSSFAWGLPLAAVAVAALGALRLTHQFPAAAASPGLLTPFLLPVLALALEAAALIALSASLLRALTSGNTAKATATGARARLRATFVLPLSAALVLAGAQLIPRGTEHPGAFANELVQSARSSCGGSGKVPVPLLGLSVVCAEPRRIEGPMPGARKAQLLMDNLVFSDDLRRVEITALELTLPSTPRVRLRADRARVAGLAPWTRSPRLPAGTRLAALSALGAALWLAAVALVRVSEPASLELEGSPRAARAWRVGGHLLRAAPGAVLAGAVISLDQAQAPPLEYAGAGALGILAVALVAWVLVRAPRFAGRIRTF